MDGKHWTLEPNLRIAEFDFGGARSLIRKELGNPVREIPEYDSSNTVDVYHDFHVHYTKAGKMEAIEFFGKDIRLTVNSQPLFPGTVSAAKELLPDLEECYGSYISRAYSVGIGAEDDQINSVLVGCKDYYSKLKL